MSLHETSRVIRKHRKQTEGQTTGDKRVKKKKSFRDAGYGPRVGTMPCKHNSLKEKGHREGEKGGKKARRAGGKKDLRRCGV